MTISKDTITGSIVAKNKRSTVAAEIFGEVEWPLLVEPTIYQFAERLCPDYSGGYWIMHQLCNGGFLMYQDIESPVDVISPNGWSGQMSEIELGITACLFTYSHLSFGSGKVAEVCADQYHMIRDFLLQQPGYQAVWACID